MAAVGKLVTFADGDQQHCGGPDRDPQDRGQDFGKKVCLQQGADLGFCGPALFMDGAERAGQGGLVEVVLPSGSG